MCLAIPGRVVDENQHDGLRFGSVDFGGVRKSICLEFVPEAVIGDYVLVHVGFAISRMREDEAQEQVALLSEIAQHDPEGSSDAFLALQEPPP